MVADRLDVPLVANDSEMRDLFGLDERGSPSVAPLVLCLDQVMDPRNLGAILRTAWFLVCAVERTGDKTSLR